jgi:hypothetical protein
MRPFIPVCLVALLAAPAAFAQTKSAPAPAHPASTAKPNAPKLIGKFQDWKAATHVEAGQTVCYAFTTAQSSVPAMTGRGDVNLTVTQRPQATRDAVAISAGFAYPANATVAVQVEAVSMDFYTAQRSAFARDGKVAVQAFLKGKQVLARSPGPKDASVLDQFSLRGFNAAYAAINKACPGK